MKQVFVRIDKYREVSDTVKQVRAKLEEAKQVLRKIKALHGQESEEIEAWQKELANTEQKISGISEALAER